MKFISIVACFILPLLTESTVIIEKAEEQNAIIEEAPVEAAEKTATNIDANDYRGPEQNLKSTIPENSVLKNEFNGNSYEILTTTVNGNREFLTLEYVGAVEACNNRSLLTFKSSEENAFVSNWLFNVLKIRTQVWIGLTRVNGTNDFVWANGAKLTPKNKEKLFKNWHKCEPNDITTMDWFVEGWGEDCVEMYSSYYPYPLRCDEIAKAGQWNDIPCLQIYNMVVCQGSDNKQQTAIIEEAPVEAAEKTATNIDANDYRGPEQNLKSTIPENSVLKNEFNGNSYEILTTTVNGNREFLTLEYVGAVEACNNRSLLTFKSSEENAFVSNWLFNVLKIRTQVWIGLTRVNGTNDFVWANGAKLTPKNKEKLFKNWHKCEPNDITTMDWFVDGWGEDCVEMYSSYYPYPLRCDEIAKAGQWNDIPCLQIYNMVVCQG